VKAQQFIAALQQIEDQSNLVPMVQLFADGAASWNPELSQQLVGIEGARRFWNEYRRTFRTIHSVFCSTIDADKQTALEWESRGTLAVQGIPIYYRGVSIIDWKDDRIVRFAAYYDPAALSAGNIEPPTETPPLSGKRPRTA